MLSLDSPSDSLDVAHGTHLDAAGASPGKLLRDLDGLINVFRFDEIEASQDLFGFTERAVPDLGAAVADPNGFRSEEHTSELQSRSDIVCRLLLEKKKIVIHDHEMITTCKCTV